MIPVDNWQDYPSLGEPMLDPWDGARPMYKASFTHQLHCLVSQLPFSPADAI
jgi:hypothetical protein